MSQKRGACPSLREPMQTGDGLLVRLGFRGGLAPEALRSLAALAGRFGNGILEVTARGNLQIRGLSEASAADLAEAVEALDPPLRSGIPVEVGPLAGLDPKEIVDPRLLAETISARIEAEGLSARLGPKVSVIVDGGGELTFDESPADIRLTATRSVDGILWRVAIGGTAVTARPYGRVTERLAVAETLDILLRIAAKGSDSRGRDLAGPASQSGKATLEASNPIGCHNLLQGRIALGVGLPFGQIRHEDLSALMDAAQAHGIEEIRLSPARALLAICAGQEAADALQVDARKLGFVTDPADVRRAIIACAGMPACGSAYIATKAIAAEIAADSQSKFDSRFRLHVSGCEKRCAGTIARGVTILGDQSGARLILEGQPGATQPVQVSDGIAAAAIAFAADFQDRKPAKSRPAGFPASVRRSSVADPIHQRPR